MNAKRHITASIFLILFSFIQLADLHIVGHDDVNDIDCKLCQFSSDNHNNNLILTEIINIVDSVLIPVNIVLFDSTNFIICTSCYNKLHNKAPPIA